MSEETIVDCRGLACPQPVIDTQAALAKAEAPFVVLVDDEGACHNVERAATNLGAAVEIEQNGLEYHLRITPAERNGRATECCEIAPSQSVVFIAAQTMGQGDDALGAVLMAAFLDTLSQFKGRISHALFVNGGVRLTVTGSPVLDQLRQLEELGVEILVCGTCLKHFGIQDQLAVGSVSNMYAIIEALDRAGRIIRP